MMDRRELEQIRTAVRAQIRAKPLVERLRAHARGEVDLTPSQIRAIKILLRKVVPDRSQTDINDTSPHRYVVEPELSEEEWREKYGPQIKTVQ